MKQSDVNKILNHKVVEKLKRIATDKKRYLSLVGGGIISILDGKEPKDFDLLIGNSAPIEQVARDLEDAGLTYVMETKFAYTFRMKNPIRTKGSRPELTVQIIKRRSVEEFPFKVQRSRVTLYNGTTKPKAADVYIDPDYYRKLITPIEYRDRRRCIEALLVVPKYIEKGFTMHRLVYEDLVAVAITSVNESVSYDRSDS